MGISQYWLFFSVFLLGCGPCLSVKKEWIDKHSLASVYVGSPDPRKENPPIGEKLLIKWNISEKEMRENPTLVVKILYKDLSQDILLHPVSKRCGFFTHSLSGKKYREKEGYLTYKAEIQGEGGVVFKEWKQHLWIERLTID